MIFFRGSILLRISSINISSINISSTKIRDALNLFSSTRSKNASSSSCSPPFAGSNYPLRWFSVSKRCNPHSNDWIQRHIRDRYVVRAWQDNYRSRAAYKLKQMDDQFSFFRKGQIVLDLGCSSGGWSQVALERIHASSTRGRVIGVDIVRMDSLENHVFIQGDIIEEGIVSRVEEELRDKKADVVICDVAPKMIGVKQDDHLACAELCLAAGNLMEKTLALKGWFVIKMFYGPETPKFKIYLQTRFQRVRSAKPPASRKESREMYFVCSQFIGRPKISEEVASKQSFSINEGLEDKDWKKKTAYVSPNKIKSPDDED